MIVDLPDTVNPAIRASVPANINPLRPSNISPHFETINGEDVYENAMSFYIEVPRKVFNENVIGDYFSCNPAERWNKHADAAILGLLWNSTLFPKWINPIIILKQCYECTHWVVTLTCRPGCPTILYLIGEHKSDTEKEGYMFLDIHFGPRQCVHKSGVKFVPKTISTIAAAPLQQNYTASGGSLPNHPMVSAAGLFQVRACHECREKNIRCSHIHVNCVKRRAPQSTNESATTVVIPAAVRNKSHTPCARCKELDNPCNSQPCEPCTMAKELCLPSSHFRYVQACYQYKPITTSTTLDYMQL